MKCSLLSRYDVKIYIINDNVVDEAKIKQHQSVF